MAYRFPITLSKPPRGTDTGPRRMGLYTNRTVISGVLWDPSQITTAAWYDAADISTVTESAGNVSQWDDKSGNLNHVTQGTGAKMPLYTAGDKVTFDGVDDQLNASSPIITDDFTGEVTMFSVSTLVVGEAGYLYGALDTDGTAFYQDTTDLSQANTRTGASSNKKPHGITGMGIMGLVHNNATTNYSFNGTLVNADFAYTYGTPTFNFSIGNRELGTAGATYWDGDHHEIIAMNSAVSTSDRQKIEGYLAWKWGIEGNLPIGHPYKDAPPFV